MFQYHYTLNAYHQPIRTQHVLALQLPWRKLPYVLETIRNIPIAIDQAHITEGQTVLFMHSSEDNDAYTQGQLFVALRETDLHSVISTTAIQLPLDTRIAIYNVPEIPHTTLEFQCEDRVGLLGDILAFLLPLHVHINGALITTHKNMAYHMFHLQEEHGGPLSNEKIQYLRNVFEYDAKHRMKEI